jgi:multimeric flavodoxin WrbA
MDRTVKVLGIFGSPRKGGNTDLLLEEALKGAAAEGALVDRLRLCDFTISPCTACQGCFQDGTCVISDDMQDIYPRLVAADIVILASPIFFYGITAQTKALVDRCQALWARKYVLHTSAPGKTPKRGFFISVGGGKGKQTFAGAILTVKYFFDAFHVAYAGELLIPGVDACGDIRKDPDALRQAFTAGGKWVAEMGCAV